MMNLAKFLIVAAAMITGAGYLWAMSSSHRSMHERMHPMTGMPGGMAREAAGDDLPGADTEGGKVFVAYCAQCHGLPDPARHSAAEWPGIVARMRQHMTTQGRALPKRQEMELLIGYLQGHARR